MWALILFIGTGKIDCSQSLFPLHCTSICTSTGYVYTWHWLVNAYNFKFYLQLVITQNIPAKKKCPQPPLEHQLHINIMDEVQDKTKGHLMNDQYLFFLVPIQKTFSHNKSSLACESLWADMTVCHLPALRFHPVPLKLSNPDQTTSL